MGPKGKRILVIDREESIAQMLGSVLTSEGYQAIAISNLDSAVSLLGTVKVDLVICNYMDSPFRRGDRWPVLETFKGLAAPGTPFLVLTANQVALRQGPSDLGVAQVVAKPFELDELLDRIAQALTGRRN